ncbi:MAG: peptidoglycan editing factor PgeF [Bryobacteraceae bacterium]
MGELLQKDHRGVLQVVPWLEIPWLEHGFGTRHSEQWNLRRDAASLKQIHSDICVRVSGGEGRVAEGDGLMSDVPGVRLAVRTADCIPLLLADTRLCAVAAVHAGWRGTARAISAKAVAAMGAHFGSRPEDLLVAVGPGIGGCCYEVGPEVAVQFKDLFPERSDLDTAARIDLAEANRRQLLAAGVPPGNIAMARQCTGCCPGEFFSWRREGKLAGRMIALISIRKN